MQFAWTMLSPAACLALPFSHISNGTIFGNKVIEHEVFLVFSATFSWKSLILRRIQRDIVNVRRSPCKVTIVLIRFE